MDFLVWWHVSVKVFTNTYKKPFYMFINYTFFSIKQINPNDSRWVEDIERKPHGLLAGQFAGMAASLYSMSQHACSVLETREVVKESPFSQTETPLKFDTCIPKNCHSWKELPSFQITIEFPGILQFDWALLRSKILTHKQCCNNLFQTHLLDILISSWFYPQLYRYHE